MTTLLKFIANNLDDFIFYTIVMRSLHEKLYEGLKPLMDQDLEVNDRSKFFEFGVTAIIQLFEQFKLPFFADKNYKEL